jgi:hypothetical protein
VKEKSLFKSFVVGRKKKTLGERKNRLLDYDSFLSEIYKQPRGRPKRIKPVVKKLHVVVKKKSQGKKRKIKKVLINKGK